MECGTGVTRDFSSSGVYFITREQLAAGEKIRFTLILDHAPIVHQVHVGCTGKILRVEPQTQGFGVAVSLETYTISCSEACNRSIKAVES